MGSVRLQRVGGLAKALVVLTVVAAALTVLSAVLTAGVLGDAEDYVAGRITEDDFLEAYAPVVLLTTAQGVTQLAAAVVTIIWMFRIATNHRTLGRTGFWSPGWAVAGWFLPPGFLFVIPFLVLRQLWRASDPSVPVGDERWRDGPVAPVVPAWWVLFGPLPLILSIVSIIRGSGPFGGGLGADTVDLADAIDDGYPLTVVTTIVLVLAAVAWVALVRGLTGRHRRLTGEDVTPA